MPANDDPITLPLDSELQKMLSKVCRKQGPVFDITNWKREWIRACVACGEGKMKHGASSKWYEYEGLTVHDFRRSALSNMTEAGSPFQMR